jgi:hypothetical protein
MKKIIYLSFVVLLNSCAISIGRDLPPPTPPVIVKNQTVVKLQFGELSYLSEDKTYGRVVFDVPEITTGVMDSGTVTGYVQRPQTETSPERWSQLPQFNVAQEHPTYVYFSFSEGVVRISLQSESTVEDAAAYFKDKVLKFIISK